MAYRLFIKKDSSSKFEEVNNFESVPAARDFANYVNAAAYIVYDEEHGQWTDQNFNWYEHDLPRELSQ